jgi:transposase
MRPTCTRRFARGQRWYRDNRDIGISRVTPISGLLDNLSGHKTPTVHRWLLRHSRFHFHFTPTCGSRTNLVERWFSALTTKKLQRSAHRNVKELAADILAWVATWNDNPRPFVWTKTADQILERLACYCTAVNVGR